MLQILTIRELRDGKKIDIPQPYGADITFKQAPRAKMAVRASMPSIWDTTTSTANGADELDEVGGLDEADGDKA